MTTITSRATGSLSPMAFQVGVTSHTRTDTPKAKFANATNFRGFPHMPGPDYVLAVAKPGEPVTTARMANGE